MMKQLLGATVAAALTFAGSASAATYMSILEYKDTSGPTLVDPAFGYVLLTEQADGKTVKVTTVLDDAVWQQSGANNIFAFNLADNGATAITENHTTPNAVYNGVSTYTHAPWGTFTDFFQVQKANGSVASGANGRIATFEFTAFNAGGLTFAGLDAVFALDGRLTATGTGNRFASNAGGWWFMGHIQPDDSGSINIAARDAFCVAGCPVVETPVPEPGTWALMIIGFGGAGAVLRRRRSLLAAA